MGSRLIYENLLLCFALLTSVRGHSIFKNDPIHEKFIVKAPKRWFQYIEKVLQISLIKETQFYFRHCDFYIIGRTLQQVINLKRISQGKNLRIRYPKMVNISAYYTFQLIFSMALVCIQLSCTSYWQIQDRSKINSLFWQLYKVDTL